VGPHESMTCGVHGIYLKFGSFNGIDPIVPISKAYHSISCVNLFELLKFTQPGKIITENR
jgi:hypothetical protein